jgi:hypothetical protein
MWFLKSHSVKVAWLLNRLRKMGLAEIVKRTVESAGILYSRVKHEDPHKWPYQRFAEGKGGLVIEKLPGYPVDFNSQAIQIHSEIINSTQPIDWQQTDIPRKKWPIKFWSSINYRPGSPFGDIRKNWELNRLQFLPHLALIDPNLALNVLKSWLRSNPYLHGPAYVASMEVALRWISIYRSVCLMDRYMDRQTKKEVTGLAVASGKYILSRLSTHSSAGNHLIVEAVGLFWMGYALGKDALGKRWRQISRKILWQEIPAQISPDGTGKEQSFWYLGFVLDAVFHYLLLEDRTRIPLDFLSRIEKALEFVNLMVLPSGIYPDFGDRDDGYVFRADGNYSESLFTGLIELGSVYFDRPEWRTFSGKGTERIKFWFSENPADLENKRKTLHSRDANKSDPIVKTYPQGGMTLMKWDRTHMLFRHSPLGLGNTCGHGHADALSLLMTFQEKPVLIDLGSGQYNGNQEIRNFFRSTAAHNTVMLGGKDQAEIIGPFLWKKSYQSELIKIQKGSGMTAEACHDGYVRAFDTVHTRKVKWLTPYELEIIDSFQGPGGFPLKGMFHLGSCERATLEDNRMIADFSDFFFTISFPAGFQIDVFRGSKSPFMGWRSGTYGKWNPIYSIVFSTLLIKNLSYRLKLNIEY